MRPPDGILRGAQRWARLLQRSTVQQAAALLRADPRYTDLSTTQYATALTWLQTVGLVDPTPAGLALAPAGRRLSQGDLDQAILIRALEELAPSWLQDADTLVREVADLPEDIAHLAGVLGAGDTEALLAVRTAHGKVDLAERARVGAAGEQLLAHMLENRWPGSVAHVSLEDDGLGYDIAASIDGKTWHLEVKTTTRRGRLDIYLSRHEYEVSLLDPAWRLVVIGLSADGTAFATATVPQELLRERAPREVHSFATWQTARYRLGPADVVSGLSFLPLPSLACPADASWLHRDPTP